MSEQTYEPLVGARLEAEVRRVLETIPFYADQRGRSFDALPVLRRDDLLGVEPTRWLPEGTDVAAALAEGRFRPLTTSGSTDEPLRVLGDTEHPLPPNTWSMHGVPEDGALVNLTAPVCLGTSCPGDVAPYGATSLLLTFRAGLFGAKDESIRRAVAAWNEFEPRIAFVNPVWLHWLHRRATQLGLSLHAPSLLALTYQYPSRCQRRALARAFAAPQVQFYGASEFAGVDLAIGCPAGHLHLVEYQAHVELLSTEFEGHDELLFSTPTSRTMPLLRYAPGDLGRAVDVEEGACALWSVPALELDGRVREVMRSATRVVTTRQFDDAVGAVEGLAFYAARSRAGAVTVTAIAEVGADVAQVEAAVREAARGLGFREVTVRFVDTLPLGPSGKLQHTGEDERHALELR